MIQTAGVEPIHILLVEDNPGDVRLVIESLKGGKIRNRMDVVTDGEAAMMFLRKRGQYAAAARPDLMLLDLNLPKKNGLEVLKEVKSDPDLKRIPVVIVTSSGSDEDVLGAYDHYANCYVTKPIDLRQFERIARSIEEFWLNTAKLPPM